VRKDFPRNYRIADQIQRELSSLVRTEVKDPGLSHLLTISAVDVSRDLSLARVYITVLEETQREMSMLALQRAGGYLRSRLAARLMLRAVPELRFYYDESVERGEHLANLIDAAVKSDEHKDSDG
jgi:ribosome-binding factor A